MYMPPKSANFTPPPSGTHPARCYRVIDLGTQKTEYKGETKFQHKILISWELMCDEKMEDGRPFTIHQRYTYSSNEKAKLREHLEAWRGKAFEDSDFGPGGFDIRNVLDKGCIVTVVHNVQGGATYANLASISPPMKGMSIPPLTNQKIYVSLEGNEFDPVAFAALPQRLRDTIAQSPEYRLVKDRAEAAVAQAASAGQSPHEDDPMNDDIPF